MIKSLKLKSLAISLVIGFSTMAPAMEANNENYDTLVIGCRPWDENIKGVGGLDTALFVDFRVDEGQEILPSNLLLLDLNDNGFFTKKSEHYNGPLAGSFSEFTANRLEIAQMCPDLPLLFNTIIIDWGTYHHISRDAAWGDFYNLLSPGGTLIIPVACLNFMTNIDKSTDKAMELWLKLQLSFDNDNIQAFPYNEMPNDPRTQLLRRHDKMDDGVTKPVIIFATK